MRSRTETSADKLRGGFYTPPSLVDVCLDRIEALSRGARLLDVLEPSVGDGAFIRGIRRRNGGSGAGAGFASRLNTIRGIELDPAEAAKAQRSLDAAGLPGEVVNVSALEWAASTGEAFDVVVGNPPFVRYQFASARDVAAIERLGARVGTRFGGVSNLWIPLLLGALARLRPGGVLALVIPTECFTGSSAAVAREWLLDEIDDLRFDLFPPESFPGVLQEVVVLSGRRRAAPRAAGPAPVHIGERGRAWTCLVDPGERNWTRLLLEPPHFEALQAARALPAVRPLGDLAKLEVSIVTGANGFFCVSDSVAKRHELEPWCRPLLPRARRAPGLVFGHADHEAIRRLDLPAWLLDFSAEAPDPVAHAGPRAYLARGEAEQLPQRFKCRIREPWYRVPGFRRGALMLSKRSHLYPRLLLNEARAFTTDTIYRGELRHDAPVSAKALVASFHSSLTLVTAEVEGRSFGGGVLELVPGEVARLSVPARGALEPSLPLLDAAARSRDPEELVARTDALLAQAGLIPAELLGELADARQALLTRRLERNREVALAA